MTDIGQQNAQPPAQPVELIHFGDLHLWDFGLGGDPWPKRLLGLGNLLLKRRHRFPRWVAAAVRERLAAEQGDYVLFSGDLSTTALPSEFRKGAEWLAPLREKWGERLIAIPGNHDRYTPKATRERWFERALGLEQQHYPFFRDLNATWRLIAFDCCVPHLVSSRGRMAAEQIEAVGELLAAARREGRKALVMGHYPLRIPAGIHSGKNHGMEGEAETCAAVEQGGAAVYLHGHKHLRWQLHAGGTVHINCGAAGQLGGSQQTPGYVKFTLGAQGVERMAAWVLEGRSPAEAQWRQAVVPPRA